jgi:hypothetical protein
VVDLPNLNGTRAHYLHFDSLPERFCERCGEKLVRKSWPGGGLEAPSVYNKRRFCNARCAHAGVRGQPKRKVKLPEKHCEQCKVKLERKTFPSGMREARIQFVRRRFCGRDCANLFQRNGAARRSQPEPIPLEKPEPKYLRRPSEITEHEEIPTYPGTIQESRFFNYAKHLWELARAEHVSEDRALALVVAAKNF